MAPTTASHSATDVGSPPSVVLDVGDLSDPMEAGPLGRIAPEQRNKTAVLIGRQFIYLHRLSNRCLLIGRIVNGADEFRGRAFDVIHTPGRPAQVLLLFGRSLRHHKKSLAS